MEGAVSALRLVCEDCSAQLSMAALDALVPRLIGLASPSAEVKIGAIECIISIIETFSPPPPAIIQSAVRWASNASQGSALYSV